MTNPSIPGTVSPDGVELEVLFGKATGEALHESGRYFLDSCNDLTQCHHGDTGNYSNPADGKLIAYLWNNTRQALAHPPAAEVGEVVKRATDGKFTDLTSFTEALFKEEEQAKLDDMIGTAVTLLHHYARLIEAQAQEVERLRADNATRMIVYNAAEQEVERLQTTRLRLTLELVEERGAKEAAQQEVKRLTKEAADHAEAANRWRNEWGQSQETVERLTAALAADRWHPIEEADRNKGPFFLYDPEHDQSGDGWGTALDGQYEEEPLEGEGPSWIAAVWCNSCDTWHSTRINPTHYMPHPTPPRRHVAARTDGGSHDQA